MYAGMTMQKVCSLEALITKTGVACMYGRWIVEEEESGIDNIIAGAAVACCRLTAAHEGM